ncbi:prepilin-type N-terminal cleavage/methylation domain-containing protein [bacterium]|nr:prepilin-type N-terminal cleavage/methylation domain-containing protein [bacterium]
MYPFSNSSKNKGFTIPELLVIITIIVIIATLTYVYYLAPSKARGRDSRRIAEINDIRKAIQMYYIDHGHYPTSTESETWCSLEITDPSDPRYCDYLRDALVPHYIKDLPQDPRALQTEGSKFYSYQYISSSSASQYKLHADLETMPSYEVYSMGGRGIVYTSPPSGNVPPIANDDFATTAGTTPVDIDVLANDVDPNTPGEHPGEIDPSTVSIIEKPKGGTTSVNLVNGIITYTNDGTTSDPGGIQCPGDHCCGGGVPRTVRGYAYIDGASAPDGTRAIIFFSSCNQWDSYTLNFGDGYYIIDFDCPDGLVGKMYIEHNGAFYRARDKNGDPAEVHIVHGKIVYSNTDLYIAPSSDSFTYTVKDTHGAESNEANVDVDIQ